MKVFSLFLVSLFLVQIYSIKVLPQADIHLDASSEEVWTPAMKALSETYNWKESFENVFDYKNKTLFDCMTQRQYEDIAMSIEENYPSKAKELRGIKNDFKTYFDQEISFEYLAAWVYFHELDHSDICDSFYGKNPEIYEKQPIVKKFIDQAKQFNHRECTGILVKKDNGTIIHGRGLDNNPGKGLRNIAVNMTLYMNNEIVGYSTDIYWFNTGFVTALVPGLVSMEENYRFAHVDIDDILENIQKGVPSQVWPFRDIVERETLRKSNFDTVIQFLLSSPSAAPMYNIIGGVNNGAILTFNEVGKSQDNPIYYMNKDAIDGWFLVQTNYDLWEVDEPTDNRRTVATRILKQVGRNVAQTHVGLFAVMDSYNVHNADTIYTGLMDPSDGYYVFFGNDGIQLADDDDNKY